MWSQYTELLNVPFATVNTIILVLSSVTCQLGVFAAERGDVHRLRMWFIITFVMGSVFIAGQVTEYAQLVAGGPHALGAAPTARSSTSPPASTACT